MSNVLKELAGGFAALATAGVVAGALLFSVAAGEARAAEYEVRLPVEKTARVSPVGEVPAAEAKPDKSGKAAKPDADKAPKTALGRAAEAAASAERAAEKAAPKKSAAPAKPAAESKHTPAPKPHAASTLVVPAETPVPVAVPPAGGEVAPPAAPAAPAVVKVKKTPPPPPAPKLDPKALVMPKTPEHAPEADAAQGSKAVALPADGLWVGELHVEFEEQRVIVHAATNRAVERATWFNQAEPRKLATDLRGVWRKKGAHVLRFDTGPVKNIIVGEHPDRLRLSVEFRDGAVKPDLEPEVKTGPEGVTVSIPLAISLKS